MGKYEDIRDAALTIMSDEGVRALTLPLLFERAHTGAGTFYHHFRDRETLIDAVFNYSYDTAMEDLMVPDDLTASPRKRFDELCKNIFRSYMTHPRELNFLYLYAFGYVEPDVSFCRVIPSIMVFTSIIDAAQQSGDLRSDASASVMARVVRSMVAGVFWGYQRGMCAMEEEDALRFARAAWHAIEDF